MADSTRLSRGGSDETGAFLCLGPPGGAQRDRGRDTSSACGPAATQCLPTAVAEFITPKTQVRSRSQLFAPVDEDPAQAC